MGISEELKAHADALHYGRIDNFDPMMAALYAGAQEIDRLREALEPFADIRYPEAHFPDGAGFASRRNGEHVSYGDIKRARAALMPNV